MPKRDRARRTQLYVPGNNEKMILNSINLPADSIIFDLEDSVPPEYKQRARNILSKFISANDFGKKEICVRMNSISSKESFKDLKFIMKLNKIDTVVIPKAELGISTIYKLTGIPTIPIIETPKGFSEVDKILNEEGVEAVAWGSGDLSLSLGGLESRYSHNEYVRTRILVSAKLSEIDAIDKVYFNIGDIEGFRKDCIEAKSLGFSGKQVVHPSQLTEAMKIFSPSKDEILFAEKVMRSYLKSIKSGKGALKIDGRLIDSVNVKIAQRILAMKET